MGLSKAGWATGLVSYSDLTPELLNKSLSTLTHFYSALERLVGVTASIFFDNLKYPSPWIASARTRHCSVFPGL